jgi:hypothetical protein
MNYVSMGTLNTTNVVLVFNNLKIVGEFSKTCYKIINSSSLIQEFNELKPFNIDHSNVKSGILNDFNSRRNYLSLKWLNRADSIIYSPIIYELVSKVGKTVDLIVCIYKYANIERLFALFEYLNNTNKYELNIVLNIRPGTPNSVTLENIHTIIKQRGGNNLSSAANTFYLPYINRITIYHEEQTIKYLNEILKNNNSNFSKKLFLSTLTKMLQS